MKNHTSSHHSLQEEQLHHNIPDIEIIDLESDSAPEFGAYQETTQDTNFQDENFQRNNYSENDFQKETFQNNDFQGKDAWEDDFPEEGTKRKKKRSRNFSADQESSEDSAPNRMRILQHINIHIVLLLVIVIFIAGIVYKIATWGVLVDPDDIQPGTYDNSYDNMVPLVDAEINTVRTDYSGDITILAFGNAPFADDRNSEDNLVNMIQKLTGATVYNCSISGSFLAAPWYTDEEKWPRDMFTFYWLTFLAMGSESVSNQYLNALELLGDAAPPEAMDVYQTLTTIDLNTVDVIVLMYDGSDYLAGHEMYNDADSTDISQFTGNMVAGIEMLQADYPNIRIIVMSPTYAFGIDDDGNYVSSDIKTYGQHLLSTYVIKQAEYCIDHFVTFVDNLYGTINEDNAPEYLIDNIHLNVEGRKKVAERFVKALYYFND